MSYDEFQLNNSEIYKNCHDINDISDISCFMCEETVMKAVLENNDKLFKNAPNLGDLKPEQFTLVGYQRIYRYFLVQYMKGRILSSPNSSMIAANIDSITSLIKSDYDSGFYDKITVSDDLSLLRELKDRFTKTDDDGPLKSHSHDQEVKTVDDCAKMIIELAQLRDLVAGCEYIIKRAYFQKDNVSNFLRFAENVINSITEQRLRSDDNG